MKIAILRIYLLTFSLLMCSFSFAQLTIKPTFESCGLYLTYTVDVENRVYYKESAKSEWQNAYPLVFDNVKNEFRGSIVRLSEDENYDVKVELYNKGQLFRTYTESFKTWTSEPTITQTLNISSFKDANYIIDNLQGSESGWIKIVGDEVVNVLNTTNEHGIRINNSKHVIIEGVTLIGGGKHGFLIDGTSSSDIRIANCDVSKWGRLSTEQTIKGVYLDADGNEINYDAGVKIYKAKNVVIERCYIHDSKAKTNPWEGTVKVGPYAGQKFKDVHPKGSTGIFVDTAKEGIVIRYNDIIGSQTHRFNDVIENSQNGALDGGFGTNADIYGNMMIFSQDDAIEIEGAQSNVRLFNNRIEQTFCGISTAPNRQGPSYIFNNVIWNLGDEEKSQSVAVKNGGGDSHTQGRQFFFNNTMYVVKNCISGVGYGSSVNRAKYYATSRNNILVSGQNPSPARPGGHASGASGGSGLSISDREKEPLNDFDYDMIGNTITLNGAGQIHAIEGSESNGIFALPLLQDPEHGVFTLKYKDPGIDKGVVIPNFTEKYHGNSPDMGALELCSSSLIPIRPLDIIAEKYYIKLTQGGNPEKVFLYAGENAPEMPFTICKSDDMLWLTVSANTATIRPNMEIELTLSASSERIDYRKVGMIIIRLQNGLSVPITISAD